MRELPGPSGERHCSPTGANREMDVAKRHGVARAWRIEDDVTVQHAVGEISRGCVDDLRAGLDLCEIRGRDRAEAAGEASILQAVLRHVKSTTSREGLRQ